MSTLTKEWLQQTVAELEEERDAVPGVVNEDADKALAAMKLALASLEAEPVISHLGSKNALDAIVAFIKSNRNPTLKDYNEVSERLFQDNCHGLSNHVIEYIKQIGEELEELRSTQDTAPPAPASVPDVVSWEDVPEEITEDDIALASAWAHGFNQCRAAMLQGAELVTTDNKLPAEAVYGYFAFNDHHGEEFFKKREDAIAFCKEAIEDYRQENAEEGCDPDEVRRTCWGIIMQEGTDFEVDSEGHIDYALTPELDGNSPVIPDGWVLVPKEMTDDIGEAIAMQASCCGGIALDIYEAMLAAAPQQEVK
ncbi:hypothetical protein L1E13_04155 [Enterobacter hormaechei]|uniref:hypothetical protein n=1 Tax=Enterobacter hormaechei TaxID=158836 RepID=UPI001F3AA6B4|nr:hypothetical protein [Enterobacter hormaechei]UJA61020.1 hypothetical protein L1E13_04155 [Enterobacter hormaechei]